MVWDGYIALYLFLAGLGAGAFFLGALTNWAHRPAARMKRIAFIVAPVAVAVGTLVLVFDAQAGFHHPLRFFLLIGNLNSVMSWGVIILSLFLLVSVIDLVLLMVKKKTPRALDVLGMVLSVGVAAYTGVLLGDASVAFPLWNMALLPLLFVVSAASSGMAAVLFITSLVAPEENEALPLTSKAGIVLPLLELALLVVLLLVTTTQAGSAAAAASASVGSLVSGSYAPAFWLGLIIIGLVVPLMLDLVHLRHSSTSASTVQPASDDVVAVGLQFRTLGMLANLCVLIGGFMLRFLIIMAALAVAFM